jgi:hypothetical protein
MSRGYTFILFSLLLLQPKFCVAASTDTKNKSQPKPQSDTKLQPQVLSKTENKTESKISLTDVFFLLGNWQAENQNLYETWSQHDQKSLKGFVYKIKKTTPEKLKAYQPHPEELNSNIEKTEALWLTLVDQKLTYQAQVFDQNDGAIISFSLNNEFNQGLSFENLNHDFPNKIQYKPINQNKILVTVRGAGDKGFSYHLLRVKNLNSTVN